MSAPSDFDTDLLRAAQYAYYVQAHPFMSDFDFDAREAEYEVTHGPLPVGSDKAEDYTPAQRALALYFLMSGRSVSSGEELL